MLRFLLSWFPLSLHSQNQLNDTKSSPMILSPNSPGVILSEADCMTEATCPAFRTGRVKLCITPTQGAEMWANVLSYL